MIQLGPPLGPRPRRKYFHRPGRKRPEPLYRIEFPPNMTAEETAEVTLIFGVRKLEVSHPARITYVRMAYVPLPGTIAFSLLGQDWSRR